MSAQLTNRLNEQEILIELTDAAKEKIAEVGYDPEYGARPIRRAHSKTCGRLLSEELLKGNVQKNHPVTIDVKDGEFLVKYEEPVNSNI